jgi:3-oxoacyl-[acyl-carrier protein] reductase
MGTVIRLFWALRIRKTWPGDRKKNRPATSWAGTSRVGSTVDEVGFHARQYHADEGQREESQGRPLNIVVTGASSGIGAALAVALARDGHKLFLCARSPDKIRKIGDETGAQVAVCDVSQEDQVTAFRRMVSDHVDAVDVLVNCAGSFGEIGPIELADTGRWLDTLRVNLFGPFLVIKHFLPLLDKSASPRIINLSGGGAFSPFPNYSAYACSKAALVRLTETLAAELAPRGIAVNAVAPGIIQTAIHKATLEAGPERAGPLAFRRTQFIMRQKDSSMENVVACIKRMLSPSLGGLTGKTISANFDAWSTEVFEDHLPEISSSDVFTLRRVNIVNLPNGALRQALSHAWAKHATEI